MRGRASRYDLCQARANVRMVYHYFEDRAGLYVAVLERVLGRLQAQGVAISPSLLAAMPYILALAVIVLARSQTHGGAMPADLTAIFRSS
jgi:AcrR family transcriptional regulator